MACIPYTLNAYKLTEPKKETKQSFEDSYKFLRYISENKSTANYHIRNITTNKYDENQPPIIFDDFHGFDMEKVKKHMEAYDHLRKMTIGRDKNLWWSETSSALFQVQLFSYSVFLCWSKVTEKGVRRGVENKILMCLDYVFDTIAEKPIEKETIKTKILQTAKNCPFIVNKPYFNIDLLT